MKVGNVVLIGIAVFVVVTALTGMLMTLYFYM